MPEAITPKAPALTASVQGTIDLPASAVAGAAALAAAQYRAAVDAEFCGDAVETYALPDWLPPLHSLLPHDHLRSLSLELNALDRSELVGTCGVDPHVDDVHGLVMIVVLHNDGLTFRQGRVRHCAAPGDWFVFDDRKPHEVIETERSTCYLALAVPLLPVG